MNQQPGLQSLAQNMASQGRYGDSMLVHMSPDEVHGLNAIAHSQGLGGMTINPHTGMPEAFSLKKLFKSALPMIAGAILTPLTGGLINPFTASALVGGGTALATGSLSKGLMAGLSAYGGASLAGAAGLGATGAKLGAAQAAANGAVPAVTSGGVATGVTGGGALVPGFMSAANPALINTPASLAGAAGLGAGQTAAGFLPGVAGLNTVAAQTAASAPGIAAFAPGAITPAGMGNIVGQTLGPGAGMAADKFVSAAKAGLPAALQGGAIEKYAPLLAASGVASALSGAFKSKGVKPPEEEKSSYKGPYVPAFRQASYPKVSPDKSRDSSEHLYFDQVNPVPNVVPLSEVTGRSNYDSRTTAQIESGLDALARGYATGGPIKSGSFIVDARTVSELGNGSSSAGQEMLAKHGGRPIRGKGDGVSDSVNTNIDGKRPARVARDEVHFSPEAVKKLGGGNHKRGTQKLYSLMANAEAARKTAKRGQDTGVRKALGA